MQKLATRVWGVSIHAVVAFCATLTLCYLMVFAIAFNRSQVERLGKDRLISERAARIGDTMGRLLYKTHALAAHIRVGGGDLSDFDRMADLLIDDPAITSLLAAPGGRVAAVFPLEGNEAVLGHDFFADLPGNAEAILARETGQLVLAGPFEAVHGGTVMAGRLPVFVPGEDGTEEFWGLVSIGLRYQQAFRWAGLDDLEILGLDYELWRISPDDGERQMIAGRMRERRAGVRSVDREIDIYGATWHFSILSERSWYVFPETWASALIGLLISLMIAVVVQKNHGLRQMKERLSELSNTDPLTGISNRRHFMAAVASQIDRVARNKSESYVIIFDLDHFKKVNDTYGHQSGDMVLKEVAARVSAILRSYDLFARYGGEEFILFVADIDRASAKSLAERIRMRIGGTPIAVKGASLTVTASFGIAVAAPLDKLDDAIGNADNALYRAKAEGRDRVVFHS